MSLPFHPRDAAFNRANALYLAHASDIAYLRAPQADARERLGLVDVIAFRHPVTRTRGFLGLCPTHAVLAFRGTEPANLPNWITDAVIALAAKSDYEGRVHTGFDAALRATWGVLAEALRHVEHRPLFVTGHSMGGALATLTACRLARPNAPTSPATATYSFGSPRMGDPAFCDAYALPTFRLVNKLDLVPEIPLAGLRSLLPRKSGHHRQRILTQLHKLADRAPSYSHVRTCVYIDRDHNITHDPPSSHRGPWHTAAVARAIATRGKSFFEGVTDHLIGNYIRALEHH